ncbi:MAG TPA: Crp/Fnr family transcriptional regulator [Tissierellaceae bacterium]|nr:Crp/Fnr family transcriptional regulator [Tissierellaceae bacterium]
MDYLSLSKTKLFHEMSYQDIEKVLQCLKYRVKSFKKEECIFSIGDETQEVGLVLSGSVFIENNDFWGNRSILAAIPKDHIFAESYALANEKLKVNVIAAEDTEVLFLNTQSLTTMCSKACYFHTQLIQNLLSISSANNIRLSQRILNTSSKTIRGRVISYLSQESQKHRTNKFNIPLNRQELADYLNVDRSALSNELGKMRDEELLSFHKNKFQLFNIDTEERSSYISKTLVI